MGAITAELVETGERRGAGGRRVTPVGRREQLVADYQASGLTMAAFARREGITYPTFASWVSKTKGRTVAKPSIRFAQMRLPLKPAAVDEPPLEVRLPDGTVVRGGGVAEVVALVRALRG